MFTVKNDPNWFWKGDTFYGFSIQKVEHFIKDHNYKIHSVDFDNVILTINDGDIIEDVNKHILDWYNKGYKYNEMRYGGDYSNRFTRFPWNQPFEFLQNESLPIEEKISFIKEKFKKYEGMYEIS